MMRIKKAAIDGRVAAENGGLAGATMVSDAFFPSGTALMDRKKGFPQWSNPAVR
ncbi:MAG: hypothetical protein R2860_07065 [Desulfobacterales bacterium]